MVVFICTSLLALPIEEIEARIAPKDVIFVIGGDTDYQMHIFKKSGFTKLLPKLLETKVYVGSSAGSMVIGRSVSSQSYRTVCGEQNGFGITEYLDLVDLALKPHMGSLHFPNNRPEILEQAVGPTSFPVYGLQDDSAIIIDGDEQRFIGSPPYKGGSR